MSDDATVRAVLANSFDYRKHPPRTHGIIVRRTQSPFAHILSPEAQWSGWPLCLRCRKLVDGYGIANETRSYVDVYAECHGHKQEIRLTRPVDEQPEWLTEVLRTLTFFGAQLVEP